MWYRTISYWKSCIGGTYTGGFAEITFNASRADMRICGYIKNVTRSLDVRLIRTYNHLHVFTRFLGATPLSEVFGVEDPCNGPSNVLSPLSSPIVFYRSHVGERE